MGGQKKQQEKCEARKGLAQPLLALKMEEGVVNKECRWPLVAANGRDRFFPRASGRNGVPSTP